MTGEFIHNPKQLNIIALSPEENAQMLAAYLPNGKLFGPPKNTPGSDLRLFLEAIAESFTRLDDKIKLFADNIDPSNTVELLDLWESFMGIPDECFEPQDYNYDIEMRQKYLVAKYAKMNITTRQEFIDLAKFFGFDLRIQRGTVEGAFPYTFPIIFFDDLKKAKNTYIITFLGIPEPGNTFPATFPIPFDDSGEGLVRCLFRKLLQSNCDIRWQYEP